MEARKTVTVLFADVTGSTALGERLDPESLRRVMQRYFDRMRTIIERHEGTVEKFIGDAVMAVFGVPVVHEDDALRALRAAAEMREALAELNAELERDWGVRLEARTGVNTGPVLAGDPSSGNSFVSGDAVNVAARLEQSAEPGEVLVGPDTIRLVRDAVTAEPVEPLALKGKSGEVAAYRLLEVGAGLPSIARRLDAPMVGRDRELSQLKDAFERVVRGPACEMVTILGDAGVGKSRLTRELVSAVADRGRVLRGRCLPYGEGITFWPVAELVKEAAGITEGDSSEEARSKIAALLADDGDASLIVDRVAAAIGLGEAGGAIQETLWAVRRLLEALARERALVVVFDDIHWAEPAFLDLLEYVVGLSRGHPLLVLCLARPELRDARPGWAGTLLALQPLSEDESERLVEGLLGQATLSEETRDRIAEAAEGNPLFVEEMLRMLIDDGLLRRDGGHWVPSGDLVDVAVPPTISALLAARLDRLDAEERVVLERASVMGKVFYVGAVAELSPDSARQAVGSRLITLVRKELIRPDPESFAGEDAFRFSHILVRDAAYESIPKSTRAELHERFAAWLEQAVGERVAEYEEILGHHLEQAYRNRAELGPVDERGHDLAQRAADRLASSGHRALSRGDMRAAANLLDRGVDLLPVEAAVRGRLLLDLGIALTETGDLARAADAFAQATGVAKATGDRSLEAQARFRSKFLMEMRDPETTMKDIAAEGEHAIRSLEELGDERGLANAWHLLGLLRFWLGHGGLAEEALERALSYADRTGAAREADEVQGGMCTVILFGPVPASDGIPRCSAILERVRGRASEAVALWTMAGLHAMVGRFPDARQELSQGDEAARDLGLKVQLAIGHPHAEVELLADNPGGVVERLRNGYEALREMGETGYLSTTASYLAEALYLQGEYEEAEHYSRMSREAAASDDLGSQVAWRSVRAKVLVRRGEVEEAERVAREAVALVSESDYLSQRGNAFMDLAEVLRLAGRPEEGVPFVQEALRVYEQKGNLVAAQRARATIAELQ